MQRPIVTFLSDFGLDDYYVSAMKAVLLRRCPEAQLVDISHTVEPQDVLAGSFLLERAVASFHAGTIHVAVVDPGVGSARRLLLGDVEGQSILCPDNGLITWTLRRFPRTAFRELTWRPPKASNTFHGRDILAPAAAELACGASLDQLSVPISNPVLLNVHLAKNGEGHILHIDRFGNATTSVPGSNAVRAKSVRVNDVEVGPLRRTYSEVPSGEPLALIGSSDLLEIAVNCGSAAERLRLKPCDRVICS